MSNCYRFFAWLKNSLKFQKVCLQIDSLEFKNTNSSERMSWRKIPIIRESDNHIFAPQILLWN